MIVEKSEIDREIYLPGGGRVTCWSAESPDTIRGDGIGGVVLDEAGFMQSMIWTHVIRPALSDTGGWAFFPTTPNGANWVKDMFDSIQAGKLSDAMCWQRPSWDNPRISYQEMIDTKNTMPIMAFRQEHGAEFVQQEGVEWPADYFGPSIWYDDQPPPDCDCKVVSNDPSKGKNERSDFNAYIKVSHDPRGIYWIDADIQRLDVAMIADRGVTICQEFRPHAIGFEVNAFQELIGTSFVEKCRHAGVGVDYHGITNTVNKRTRIRTLTPLLASGRIKIKNNPGGIVLVDQLRQFPLPQTHDDGPDALEMGIRLCDQMRGNVAIAR